MHIWHATAHLSLPCNKTVLLLGVLIKCLTQKLGYHTDYFALPPITVSQPAGNTLSCQYLSFVQMVELFTLKPEALIRAVAEVHIRRGNFLEKSENFHRYE